MKSSNWFISTKIQLFQFSVSWWAHAANFYWEVSWSKVANIINFYRSIRDRCFRAKKKCSKHLTIKCYNTAGFDLLWWRTQLDSTVKRWSQCMYKNVGRNILCDISNVHLTSLGLVEEEYFSNVCCSVGQLVRLWVGGTWEPDFPGVFSRLPSAVAQICAW